MAQPLGTKLDQNKLAKLKNVGNTRAEAICAVIDTEEELAAYSVEELQEVVDDMPDNTANAVINWAKKKHPEVVAAASAFVAAPTTPTPATDTPTPTVEDLQKDPAKTQQTASLLGMDASMLQSFVMMQAFGGGGGNMMQGLAGTLPPRQLLDMYDPTLPSSLGSVILTAIYGEEPIIAFKPGTNEVAKEETAAYLDGRRRHRPAKTQLRVNGELVNLLSVGVLPMDYEDEDPLVRGQLLDEQGISYTYPDADFSQVKKPARQYIRVMIMESVNALDPADNSERRAVLRLAREQGLEGLMREYPTANAKYRELESVDNLPRLRVRLGAATIKKGGSAAQAPSFRPRYNDTEDDNPRQTF